MNNLYKFLLVSVAVIAFPFQTKAQWSNEDLLISEQGYNNQDLVQVAKTPDDKIFISWLCWEGKGEDIMYSIKLQLLDKEGNPLLGTGGMYVTKKPTPTWSSGYAFALTKEGEAVIVSTDMRNGEWQPYAYKISQKGEQLWGTEGVALLKPNEGAAFNPRICLTDAGSLIIGYKIIAKSGNKVSLTKRFNDGSPAWGSTINVLGAGDALDLVSSGNDSFILSYFETDSYFAQKYDTNGEAVWSEPAVIDDSGSVKTTSEPNVLSDGEGGIVAAWRFAASSFTTAGKVQHISADGKRLCVDEAVWFDDLPVISVDAKRKNIYAFCNRTISSGVKQPLAWKMDFNGSMLWSEEGVDLSGSYGNFSIYGAAIASDGIVPIYRNASNFNRATIEYSKIGFDGNVLSQNTTVSAVDGDKGRGDITPVIDNHVIIAWTDNSGMNGGRIFAHRFQVQDGVGVNSLTETDRSVTIYPIVTDGPILLTIRTPEAGEASVRLLDLNGRLIANLGTCLLSAGETEELYTLNGLTSGVYLINVSSSSINACEKLIIK